MKYFKKNEGFNVFPKNKKQKAEKVANWIIESILKMSDDSLKQFYLLIEEELKKRGVF